MPLTDLATARQAIPRLAAVPDAEITRLIAEASDLISTYCLRSFGPATFTEMIDADGSGAIFLQQRPITAITSITLNPASSSPVVLDPSRYAFEAATGEVRGVTDIEWFPGLPWSYGASAFGAGWQSATVVYTAGSDPVPPAVAGRCLALVSRLASALATAPHVQSLSLGDRSVGYAGVPTLTLNDEDRKALALYRLVRL